MIPLDQVDRDTDSDIEDMGWSYIKKGEGINNLLFLVGVALYQRITIIA